MLQRNRRSTALALSAVALAGALTLTACGSDENKPAPGQTSAASIACAGKGGTLLGAGSTAQGNAMDVWKTAYTGACSGTTVNYSGGGSGAGVQQFNQGQVAFAGTDYVLKPADVDASKAVCTGGRAIDLPMVGGLVSLVYNVDGVDNLVLDGPTAAKIFDSQITKWNDPAIAALNPGATLPDAEIQSFHRSDDSGTTYNLTSYFAKTSGGAWSAAPDKAWKGRNGQSANGSAGLSAQIKQVKNSIGYAELSYAQINNLKSARISTGAAKPVEATTANAANTFATSTVSGTDGDLALSLDYGTKADNAYPIILATYEIACDKGNKAATLDTLKSFLTYTISDAAQKAIGEKGYVPLPASIGDRVKSAVAKLA
ncbi:phosphate ABC transporter substrate-binding protein PstS [Streptomyces sp. CBMA156]|uniref:phosphate ABC transporter substrate-binding protein PstS n=1 Tax=Streptomyces sp. CBMA156 TaxID=1930280 RepID=UPI0016618F09|nr:phosphate ABC transporter substrate-binding protein PstS [Streptomyces sp. CBMA156]MBD0670819.1 phosphate ABC transporter substrate-binding protein PstS [Streptomyces sp. CBMA156]MBD0671470.1 phosphate ABC transporter substrate-binding protein PstS [Streptomyces sp. CBMA156]